MNAPGKHGVAGDRLSGRASPRFTPMLALILYLIFLYTGSGCSPVQRRLLNSAESLAPVAVGSPPSSCCRVRIAAGCGGVPAGDPAGGGTGRPGRRCTGHGDAAFGMPVPLHLPGAYGLCPTVGLEAAAWSALAVLPPVLALRLTDGFPRAALILPAVGYGLFILWLSGLRAGYAGTALAAGHLACGWRRTRGLRDTFRLRVRMLGCCLVCALGVFVPLLLYAAPRCLLAGALLATGKPEAPSETAETYSCERNSRATGNTGVDS